ncbi:hypothetical protein QYE76_063393 [Lolium multiflorum]|uniref:F-box domain-containing protein n=1 Tax=Lolium multiflorum TaxID=4521 RepID=A0AAD8W6Z4_LOLMU|nr:hypothetical protein QYE76_063393 [Lolium multiflorum]
MPLRRLHPQIHASGNGVRMTRRGESPADIESMPLHEDMLREILLRLPPRPSSLLRASAVCKHWRGLVTDLRCFSIFRAEDAACPGQASSQRESPEEMDWSIPSCCLRIPATTPDSELGELPDSAAPSNPTEPPARRSGPPLAHPLLCIFQFPAHVRRVCRVLERYKVLQSVVQGCR